MLLYQRIDVKRIATSDIEQALVSRRALEPDMAHRVARVAGGSWLKALQVLDTDSESREFLDMFISLMRLAYQRKIDDIKRWSDTVATFGQVARTSIRVY